MKGNKSLLYKVFFALFGVLYLMTAFISFLHAIEFFSIGNELWMSYVLSAVFEIGQMSVLMSLLISENSKKALPWFLMFIFTSVQVISNVYSVTKYIMLSEVEYHRYLERALKFLIQDVPQDMIVTVIAWIIGGLLPICALLLTAMCASQISIIEEKKEDSSDVLPEKTEETPTPAPVPAKNDPEPKKEAAQPVKPEPAPIPAAVKKEEKQTVPDSELVVNKPKAGILSSMFRKKKREDDVQVAEQGYYQQPEGMSK